MSVFASNAAERSALSLLLQNIKVDLSLNDTQLGLLTGIAFAAFYSVMGIPIARWADRGNRVTIISITTALWSVAVTLCGVVTSFTQLLFIRVGAAVGEAGCMPPAQSLIADHFERADRARAMAIYMLGGPLSALIGFFGAGWLNVLYGWRATFAILGVVGMCLSIAVRLTLREPRRKRPPAEGEPLIYGRPPSLTQVGRTLWACVSFRHLLLFYSVSSFFVYGLSNWTPAFFIRSFGLSTRELGIWFAVIFSSGGVIGTWWGGHWASRRAPNDEAWQLKVMAIACIVAGVIWGCLFLSANRYMAFGLFWVGSVAGALINAPLFATIQTLVPEQMRAVSIAILFLFANLIGMGLGPLAAGVLSDTFRPWAAGDSLRYALLALCPGYLWGGWHVWRASKTVARDVAPNALVERRVNVRT